MAASTQNDPWPHIAPTNIFAFQDAAAANGNGNAYYCSGQSSVVVQVVGSGGWNATVTFEGTVDETNWIALQAININSGAVATTTTADGIFVIPTGGALSKIRARVSAYVGGTITATGRAGIHGSRDIGSIAGTVDIAELPTAAALADNTANPTTTLIGAMGHVWDGATWDRTPGDSTNGTKVQPAVGGAGAVTAVTPRTTLASDDPAVVALQIIDDWDETNRAAVNIVAGQVGVTAGAGAVAANTPRTTLASDDPAVTALQIMDDWDETNRAAVNTIAGQVGVQGGAGTVTALTQRVAIATDANVVDTELTTADMDTGAGTDNRAVVGLVLPAAGGGVLATGDTVNGLDVDVTRVPAPLSTTGGGTEAAALRVTIASDSTGVVSIDDNSGSLTVDGAVTANAGTNLNTSLLALEAGGNLAAAVTALQVMDDWDETNRCAVNLITGNAGVTAGAGGVDAGTLRVAISTNANEVKEVRSATGTTTQTADSATNVTLKAANANRLGLTVQNTSSAVLYLKCGATATATDFTARLVQYGYWEAPYGYTGIVDGIWASDPGDGAAAVTEFS